MSIRHGGFDGTNDVNTGGIHNPGTNSWTASSSMNSTGWQPVLPRVALRWDDRMGQGRAEIRGVGV
jgi:hypothetical protein